MDAEDPDGWMEGVHGAFCLFGRVEHKNKRSKDVYAIKNASTDFKTVFPETNYLLEMRFFNPASVFVQGARKIARCVWRENAIDIDLRQQYLPSRITYVTGF